MTVQHTSLADAKENAKSLMLFNGWTEAELFTNDCISPSMDDGYLLEHTAKVINGKVEWKPTNYKPI